MKKTKNQFEDEIESKINSPINNEDTDAATAFFSDMFMSNQSEEEMYKKLSKERSRRVAEAVNNTGADMAELEQEMGFVAPIPVSTQVSDLPAIDSTDVDDNDFQKAMQKSAKDSTIAFKLNVETEEIELTNNKKGIEIDEETINNILKPVADEATEEKVIEKIDSEEKKSEETIVSDNVDNQTDIIYEKSKNETHNNQEILNTVEEIFEELNESNKVPKDQLENEKSQQDEAQTETIDIDENKEEEIDDETDNETDENDRFSGEVKTEIAQDICESINEQIDSEELESSEQEEQLINRSDYSKYRKRELPVHWINFEILEESIAEISSQSSQFSKYSATIDAKKIKQTKKKPVDKVKKLEENQALKINLEHKSKAFSLRVTIAFILTLITFICTITTESTIANGTANSEVGTFAIISLIALLTISFFCFPSIKNGLKVLLKNKANSDTAISIATIFALIQNIFAIFNQHDLILGNGYIYCTVTCFAWLLHSSGKLFNIKRTLNNLNFLVSKENKYGVGIYKSEDINEDLGQSLVAYQKKEDYLTNFKNISEECDPKEKLSQKLTLITILLALAVGLTVMLISKNIFTSISTITAILCISVPVISCFIPALNLSQASKRARRKGAMIAGQSSINYVSGLNSIMVDSSDIFIKGTVAIEGINFYEESEEKIGLAVALMKNIGGVFADLAYQLDENETIQNYEIENYIIESGNGLSASVMGKKVLVGNIDLILKHEIPLTEEQTFNTNDKEGRKILYISVDGSIVATLRLKYRIDSRKKMEFKELNKLGLTILVYSIDPNVTSEMIASLCEIPDTSIKILNTKNSIIYEDLTSRKEENLSAYIVTKGRTESFMFAVRECLKHKNTMPLIIAVQIISLILGVVLVSVVSIIGAGSQIPAISILGCMAFCTALGILLLKFKL